ncbi:chaperone modulator CbpM [Methylobacterium symbioticum]|uniref:Chaperone modulatory protein CbpM n=1 Tax=Methylobacterium symbioticum TaxID=2584084 RepID=A0A509EGD6_9HYPH|nr:chaperone modulator CbpM [Methylobacterium symbioticum]VUD73231.1 Chaperone modulatory protein CbpM [Methylobacterium symbioticum]
MDAREFQARTDLRPDTLRIWLESGWLRPAAQENVWQYVEIDLARAQLIQDLQHDLGINDDGVAVVLDLIDQVGGLRNVLQAILRALQAQPEMVRRQIVDACAAQGPISPPN